MIKKALIAAAAFLALSAHAGYAQLAPPAGFSTSSGGFTYAAAANDRVYGKVIHQAGALTANVGGQAVKMPAAYRLAANAPRIAAAAIYLHPGVRTAVGIAAWLGAAAFVYNTQTGLWEKSVDREGVFETDLVFWTPLDNVQNGSPSVYHSSASSACGKAVGAVGGYVTGVTDGNCVYRKTIDGKEYGPYNIDVFSKRLNCPPGTQPTSGGCKSVVVKFEPVPEEEFIRDLPLKPMPSTVPQELPYPTPLPVEQPWINPSPGENPQSQPLRVPTGTPVPIPNTDPQQYRQPYVDIVPAPTPDKPWQVDVKPGETTSTNPNPVENPQPDSQDKPAEEEDKSLCEKHPEIAACEKVEVTDKPLPDQPKLYEPKYPDGITGVWNSKLQEIKATPLFNLAPSLLPNVSAGTCPSWKVDLSIDGWTNAGLQDVSPPCWVWDVAKLVIIASALLLARRLIFGG